MAKKEVKEKTKAVQKEESQKTQAV